jgi:hypothetical protein
MSVTITNNNVTFESHSLTGGGLFLYGFYLHNFFSHTFTVFESRDKFVNDLGFFNRHSPSEDFFNGGDFVSFN